MDGRRASWLLLTVCIYLSLQQIQQAAIPHQVIIEPDSSGVTLPWAPLVDSLEDLAVAERHPNPEEMPVRTSTTSLGSPS